MQSQLAVLAMFRSAQRKPRLIGEVEAAEPRDVRRSAFWWNAKGQCEDYSVRPRLPPADEDDAWNASCVLARTNGQFLEMGGEMSRFARSVSELTESNAQSAGSKKTRLVVLEGCFCRILNVHMK